ncbi:BF2992 family fimbrillin-A clan protein [Bacteroides gallinaceum]|uniref:BF2992 family fimbrillin-A clan protein n=1 Tax=Bacteroides gallinaceum TaxID=1462571 RepID=UPI00195D4DFA|nr:BF2992 family fimbrillin-A clan protein [Bacteroides gallinaceum]MBM6659384.1 BF2992 family fimbrillin-A clan protein [Bacteroides gallinaceum]
MKKKILSIISICATTCLFYACSQEEVAKVPVSPEVPEGKVAVTFTIPGMIAKPLDGFAEESRSILTDLNIPVTNLPDGTTLWLFAEDVPEGEVSESVEPKSYVVRDIDGMYDDEGRQLQQLLPCTVDEEGNLISETSVPLYLTFGHTYRFRAVSPARKFVEGATDENGEPVYAFYVDNKDYVIATDDRYEETKAKVIKIDAAAADEGSTGVEVVEMNPLINQTAQLEFTIEPEENNPYIHSISVLPQGIEISGVQDRYSASSDNSVLWNWSTGEPLHAYTGDNNTRFLIRKDTQFEDAFIEERENGSLYIKCPILPTNAFSTSIIVVFNLQINGSPTQYEMMLNQKIYQAAYTYHYKGKVSIQDGVSVITWQYVNWSKDVPIIPQPESTTN